MFWDNPRGGTVGIGNENGRCRGAAEEYEEWEVVDEGDKTGGGEKESRLAKGRSGCGDGGYESYALNTGWKAAA